MNCTAWNSVRAKALASRPSATPKTASTAAIINTSKGLPGGSSPRTQIANPVLTAACTTAASPKAMP
jgi:hypothetical protein